MWGAIISAAAQMIGGAVISGVTAYQSTKEKVQAYKNAALDIQTATNLYSGTNLNNAMTEKGIANAATRNAQAMGAAASNFDGTSSTKMANFIPLKQNVINSDRTTDAYNAGANRYNTEANAKYNQATTRAQQIMNQADINYNVANKTGQAVSNAAGSIANLAGQIGGFGRNQENK